MIVNFQRISKNIPTCFILNCNNRLIWIEGIGDINNGVFYTDQLGLCNNYNNIECFSDSSGVLLTSDYYPCDSMDTFVDVINNVDDLIINNTAIEIFPNPAKHQLNFTLSDGLKTRPHSYIIYSLNGIEVLNAQLNHNIENIDITHLKTGTYIIHFLKDDVSIASGRFVKME